MDFELISILKIIHVITALLMVWPFYALVAVNQRTRLGPPLGNRVDNYMENVIKSRTIPCFMFQATALLTGVALVLSVGEGLGALFVNPALGLKFLLLLFMAISLSYVHFRIQPQIDALLTQTDKPMPEESVRAINALRLKRKRMASMCLFAVLTSAMLGVQVLAPLRLSLTILLLIILGFFSWRTYKSGAPYGWL